MKRFRMFSWWWHSFVMGLEGTSAQAAMPSTMHLHRKKACTHVLGCGHWGYSSLLSKLPNSSAQGQAAHCHLPSARLLGQPLEPPSSSAAGGWSTEALWPTVFWVHTHLACGLTPPPHPQLITKSGITHAQLIYCSGSVGLCLQPRFKCWGTGSSPRLLCW